MILSKTIEVPINGRNCRYYESLGYKIPRYKDSNYRMCIHKGTTINVKVEDLNKSSTDRVLRKCDVCKEISEVSFSQYRDICVNCANSGERNNRWRDGVSKKRNHCLSCGKEIDWRSKRCLRCFQKGENNSNYNKDLNEEERKRCRSIIGYKNWKDKVHQKDDFICQKCGSKDNLNAHHIINFSKRKDLRTNSDNGITFCQDCHRLFHNLFGRKNNDMKQLNEFLGE